MFEKENICVHVQIISLNSVIIYDSKSFVNIRELLPRQFKVLANTYIELLST